VLALAGALGVAAGCGGSQHVAGMRVNGSDSRLTALLREHGVRVGRNQAQSPESLRSAWQAFRSFSAIRVDSDDLSSEQPNDDLLFEFGVFDFGGKWGRTFQLAFVRQYATADGELQQVHLVAHFPATAFAPIQARLATEPCGDGQCPTSCSFGDPNDFLGTPCSISTRAAGAPGGRRVESAAVWGSLTAVAGTGGHTASWVEFVETSPVFREVLSRKLQPLGFEVWQDSTE
jgi:hypothetical protein